MGALQDLEQYLLNEGDSILLRFTHNEPNNANRFSVEVPKLDYCEDYGYEEIDGGNTISAALTGLIAELETKRPLTELDMQRIAYLIGNGKKSEVPAVMLAKFKNQL